MKPRVFVTRLIPEKGVEIIKDFCDVDLWHEDVPPAREDLLQHIRGVDGILCLLTDKIDGEIMDEAGPQLKVISNFAVGYDNIDVPAATVRKIPVGNTPDVLTDATADFAFALLMTVARRIPESERYVHEAKWKTWGPMTLLGMALGGPRLPWNPSKGWIGSAAFVAFGTLGATALWAWTLALPPQVAVDERVPHRAGDERRRREAERARALVEHLPGAEVRRGDDRAATPGTADIGNRG